MRVTALLLPHQYNMRAHTPIKPAVLNLLLLLGEVQRVDHRYVPHAAGSGKRTSQPGRAHLQTPGHHCEEYYCLEYCV